MKTLEFHTRVNADKSLPVPPEMARELEPEQAVHVIVVVPEPDENQEWVRITAEQFLKGYADSDAIYDNL
jgi:hypothetical protein